MLVGGLRALWHPCPVRIADIMALVVPPVTELLRRSREVPEGREPQPMFPTLIAVRNDRVVATVGSPRLAVTLTGATTMAVGLDPQALVLAAEATDDGTPALTYAVMTRDRQAKWVLQAFQVEDGKVASVATPTDGGEPANPAILQALAEAMAQRPIDVTTVGRTELSGTFGNQPFLPPEQGRVVVDAGTVKTLQERVQGVAGQALYLARSPEAGRLALEAGLPRACLITSDDRPDGRS